MHKEGTIRLGSGQRERMAGAKAEQGVRRIKCSPLCSSWSPRHLVTQSRKQVLSLLFALLSHLINH